MVAVNHHIMPIAAQLICRVVRKKSRYYRAAECQPSESLLCMMRGGNSAQYSAGFITGFVGFRLRNRIKDYASTGLHGGDTVFHQRRADHNAGVEIAVRGENNLPRRRSCRGDDLPPRQLTAWRALSAHRLTSPYSYRRGKRVGRRDRGAAHRPRGRPECIT